MKCSYYDANACRSCTQLPVPYAEQLLGKQAIAEHALAAFAPASWLAPCASREQGFRNKAKMAIGGSCEAPTLGLLDPAGAGIDLMHCALYPDSMRAAFAPIRQALIAARVPPYQLDTRRGEGKYVLLTEAPGSGELLLRFVLRSREAIERIARQIPALQLALPMLRVVSVNLLPEHKAVTEGEREIVLTTIDHINCQLNDVRFRLTPRAFLQTHSAGAAALYAQAREWIELHSPARVWDLYCGVGGFAMHAAASGRKVVGVESASEAIDAARASHPAIDWVCADAVDWACAQTAVPDCVIVNPPRRGIGPRLAAWLDQSKAPLLLYSSCNIDSLARDLQALPHYRIDAARLFDLFAHTTHFETLVLLQRRSD